MHRNIFHFYFVHRRRNPFLFTVLPFERFEKTTLLHTLLSVCQIENNENAIHLPGAVTVIVSKVAESHSLSK